MEEYNYGRCQRKDVSEEYNIMQSRVKGNEKAITTGTSHMEKQRGVLLDLQRQLKETNEELDKQTDGFVQASEKFASAGKKYEELGGKIGKIGGFCCWFLVFGWLL